MYALFAVCNALSPNRIVDENIANISKERYGEQFAKMARGGEDSLSAFEELFLYACPKFITANPPPYDEPTALAQLLSSPSAETSADPTQRHLSVFLADMAAQASVPTLRSFLKLYTSLGTQKLANFLDADEEEMVQELMVLKQASKHLSRLPGSGNGKGGLLEGQSVRTSDLNFFIDDDMVHITESTYGRRYATWFIKNTEKAQRIFDDLRGMPLPQAPKKQAAAASGPGPVSGETKAPRTGGHKVAWGGAKVV